MCALAKYDKFLVALCLLLSSNLLHGQRVSNYVSNGSFEEITDCSNPLIISKSRYWNAIDSANIGQGGMLIPTCSGLVPKNVGGYQQPRTGLNYARTTLYCPLCGVNNQRYFPKNRLKRNLVAGSVYCVRMYVCREDSSALAIDALQILLADESIDTIKYAAEPLTYLNPQISQQTGVPITDTANWVEVKGTYTATGNEKYLILGNFKSNAQTVAGSTLTTPNSPNWWWSEYWVDDVSCIEVNLPAYAGRDTTIYLGDSTYIGREPDFAIDSGCVWYRLPTTTAIDTISGMWVKPNAVGSYTYVVRQDLECSSLKWDTVVVKVRAYDVGLRENRKNNWVIDLYPNPAGNTLTVQSSSTNEDMSICIFDITGREVLSKQLRMENQSATVELNLANGSYTVKMTNTQGQTVAKKLVVYR